MTNPNSIHSNLDKVDEYNNNRPLYEAKVKYFTKNMLIKGSLIFIILKAGIFLVMKKN